MVGTSDDSRPTEARVARAERPAGKGRRWLRLLAGVLILLLFAFGCLPLLQRLGPVRGVKDAAERRGIDSAGIFYTDVEVFSEAEAVLRDALRPSRRDGEPAHTDSDAASRGIAP